MVSPAKQSSNPNLKSSRKSHQSVSSPATQKDDTLHLSFDLLEVQQVKEGTNLSDSSQALRGRIRELMGDRLKNNSKPREKSTNVMTHSKSPPKSTVGKELEKQPGSQVRLNSSEKESKAPATQQTGESRSGWKKKEPLVERSSPQSPQAVTDNVKVSRKILNPNAVEVPNNRNKMLTKNASPQRSIRSNSAGSERGGSPAVVKSPPRTKQSTDMLKGVARSSRPQFEVVDDRKLETKGTQGRLKQSELTSSKTTVKTHDLVVELLHNLKLSSVISVKDLEQLPLESKNELTMRDESRLNEKIIEILADKIISEKENRVQTEIQIEKLTTQNKKQIQVLEKMLQKSQSQLAVQSESPTVMQEKSPLKSSRIPSIPTGSSSRLREVPSVRVATAKTPTTNKKKL